MLSFLKKYFLRKVVTDEDTYLIVGAVRGPDSTNDSLKYIFTARIRWLAGINGEIPFTLRGTSRVSLSDIVYAIEEVSECDYHYLAHVGHALDKMLKLGLISKREYDFLEKLRYGLVKLIDWREFEQIEGMNIIKKAIEKYSEFIE